MILDEKKDFQRWLCAECGWIYDEVKGHGPHSPGTYFEETGHELASPGAPRKALPFGWVCPECGAAKSCFDVIVEK